MEVDAGGVGQGGGRGEPVDGERVGIEADAAEEMGGAVVDADGGAGQAVDCAGDGDGDVAGVKHFAGGPNKTDGFGDDGIGDDACGIGRQRAQAASGDCVVSGDQGGDGIGDVAEDDLDGVAGDDLDADDVEQLKFIRADVEAVAWAFEADAGKVLRARLAENILRQPSRACGPVDGAGAGLQTVVADRVGEGGEHNAGDVADDEDAGGGVGGDQGLAGAGGGRKFDQDVLVDKGVGRQTGGRVVEDCFVGRGVVDDRAGIEGDDARALHDIVGGGVEIAEASDAVDRGAEERAEEVAVVKKVIAVGVGMEQVVGQQGEGAKVAFIEGVIVVAGEDAVGHEGRTVGHLDRAAFARAAARADPVVGEGAVQEFRRG